MNTEQINDVLDEFGKVVGIPALALDESGTCSLRLNENHDIDIVWQQPRLLLVSVVGSVPSARDQARVYGLLMEAHLFGVASGGGYFGANAALGETLLIHPVEREVLSLEVLQRAIDEHAVALRFWVPKLARGLTPEDAGSVDTADAAAPIILRA